MNWNIDSGAQQRAQFSYSDSRSVGSSRPINQRNERISRVGTNAMAALSPPTGRNLPGISSSNRLRFKPSGQAPAMSATSKNHQDVWKPTINPLFSKVSSSASKIFADWSANEPRFQNLDEPISRLLPSSQPSSKLAPNSIAANRLEISNRLAALQGTYQREGLEGSRRLNPALTGKSTAQLLSQIQNLQNKNRVLMRMAPPDSQRNGQVALRIEEEYDKNKKTILPMQKEILLRLKLDDGQLTPLMIAVFDNANPQKFSLDTNSQIRFPSIPAEWNINDPSTQRFEQIKARANSLIDRLDYSQFADPSFCARKEADLNKARQLSRMTPAQIAGSTNIPLLRQLLNKNIDDMRNARELGQLMSELNPKRNLADAEAFAHYKAMGFFATKILKQLDRSQGAGISQRNSSITQQNFSEKRAFSQLYPVSPAETTTLKNHSFGVRTREQNSRSFNSGRVVAARLSAKSEQMPFLGQSDRLVERSSSSQPDQIARLRSQLKMDKFEKSDTAPLSQEYEERFGRIQKEGNLQAAQREFQTAKKERQNLQTLIQAMRTAGETPGDVEQRSFKFYYYKAQAAEGLILALENRK